MKKILIFGATSAIAEQYARRRAVCGDELFLVGRNLEKLQIMATDLRARKAGKVECFAMDANDFDRYGAMWQAAKASLGSVDIVLVAHGTLPEQAKVERDFQLTEEAFRTNFLSVVALLTPVATDFEARRSGTIAVISSVAGDRGRMSNYVYGSAKGALSIYLAGLRGRLQKAGVAVVTLKPGFVDTPMTAHLKKGLLFASAAKVAAGMDRAIEKQRDVAYLPGFWFWIMLIIRLVPERIFKRTKL